MAENIEIGEKKYKLFYTHIRPDIYSGTRWEMENLLEKAIALKQVKCHAVQLYPIICGATICEVKDCDSDRILVRGYAFCSDRDNFCKRIGRNISKQRALRSLQNVLY